MSEIDWASIAESVVYDVLGEPNRRFSRSADWRYGNRGSLSVDVGRGVWCDHESGESGGLLDLVEREQRCDRAGALEWLRSRSHLPHREPRSSAGAKWSSQPPVPPSPSRSRSRRSRSAALRLARALWSASQPVPGTPADLYLHARCVWPVSSYRFDAPLPGDVRWLPRGRAPGVERDAAWFGVPVGLPGLLLFAFRSPATGEVEGVLVEALDGKGRCPANRWRRAFGSFQRALFEARAGDGAVHIAEGPLDALALLWAPWFEPRGGRVVSLGGTSGLAGLRAEDVPGVVGSADTVVLHPDGDAGGRRAVAQAQAHIQAAGKVCRIRRCPPDLDPVDEWVAWLAERAQAFERDCALHSEGAFCAAWTLAVLKYRRNGHG